MLKESGVPAPPTTTDEEDIEDYCYSDTDDARFRVEALKWKRARGGYIYSHEVNHGLSYNGNKSSKKSPQTQDFPT